MFEQENKKKKKSLEIGNSFVLGVCWRHSIKSHHSNQSNTVVAWNIPHHSKVKISKRSIPSSNKVSWVRISMEKPYLQQLSQRALQTLQSLKNKCFRNRTFALDFISQIFNYLFFNHFFYQNNTNTPSNFWHVPHVLFEHKTQISKYISISFPNFHSNIQS